MLFLVLNIFNIFFLKKGGCSLAAESCVNVVLETSYANLEEFYSVDFMRIMWLFLFK